MLFDKTKTESRGTTIVRYCDVEIMRDELIVLRHVDLCIGEGEFVYLSAGSAVAKAAL